MTLAKNVIKICGSNVTLMAPRTGSKFNLRREIKMPTKKCLAFSTLILILIGSVFLTACGAKPVTLDVDMTEYKFTPDEFTVPAGAEITINLKNSGYQHHQFQILVLGAKADEQFDQNGKATEYWSANVVPHGKESLTFTAPSEPGDYTIRCAFPGHTKSGMVATLHVQ
jgi:uncharacterized cupredoxin-like copper-binding protein